MSENLRHKAVASKNGKGGALHVRKAIKQSQRRKSQETFGTDFAARPCPYETLTGLPEAFAGHAVKRRDRRKHPSAEQITEHINGWLAISACCAAAIVEQAVAASRLCKAVYTIYRVSVCNVDRTHSVNSLTLKEYAPAKQACYLPRAVSRSSSIISCHE